MLYQIHRIMIVVAATLAFIGSAPSLAGRVDIAVSQAWSRATPNGAKIAGGYLRIENRGTQPDRLLSESGAAASKIEIHKIAIQDGIMTMRPLEDGLIIPPEP